MNATFIDQIANAIGSADIGAPWTVNDYPGSVSNDRYRKLAVAAIESLMIRRPGYVLLVVDDGGSARRDLLIEALDRVMVHEHQPEPSPMVFTNECARLTEIAFIGERPREDWRRGFPRRSR